LKDHLSIDGAHETSQPKVDISFTPHKEAETTKSLFKTIFRTKYRRCLLARTRWEKKFSGLIRISLALEKMMLRTHSYLQESAIDDSESDRIYPGLQAFEEVPHLPGKKSPNARDAWRQLR